jgi:hypothetical protein
MDSLRTGSLENIAHLLGGSEPDFELVEYDVSVHTRVPGERD